jgi:hypothetical protein
MYIISKIPHLHNLKLTMAYRELPEHESQLVTWMPLQKWKIDPDANRFCGFAPRTKYFVNGELVREEKPGLGAVSRTPFPDGRVPRKGLSAVSPHDPDYARICREQGLEHLLGDNQSRLLLNSVNSSSPTSVTSSSRAAQDNDGTGSPSQVTSTTVNGNSHQPVSPSSETGAQPAKPLANGIHGINGSGV